jgi:hypothetical protein
VPKNESFGLLRDAQRSATGPEMRQRAGQKLGEVGKSFGTATDSLLEAIRPKEPRIAGVDKNGQPLYEDPFGFGPPITKREYDIAQMALGMIGGGGGPSGMAMGARLPAMGRGPVGRGLPRPTAEVLPPDPSIFNRGPGRIIDPLPRSPEILPPGNNPFARPGAVIDPLSRGGTGLANRGGSGLATTGGAPVGQGGGLGFPRPTGMRPGESGPMPMPGSPAIPKDPFAGFGDQFANIKYGPDFSGMAKKVGGAMLGSGALAAGAGMLSARDPQAPAAAPSAEAPPYPTLMGAGIAAGAPYLKDAVGAGMEAFRSLGDPQLPPEPIRASGRDKKRGVPVQQSGSATQAVASAMQQGQGQPVQQSQGGQQGGGAGPGYWIDMLQAADTGDAYARDLVALREQARAAAIQATQRGEELQFVPVMDYRGNKMHFVNAGGGDVVLDMNDEQDRAQYQRIVSKTGFAPEQLQQWASRTSAPLMGYFERGGGPRRPDFDPNQRIELPSQVR